MVGENSNHIFIVILFIMPVFLVTYSIYIALLLGILVGSLMIFRLSKDHAFYYVLILSVLFSFFSLISVLLFASFEEIIISQDTWEKNPIFEKESLEHMEDIMEEAGELKKRVDYDKFISNVFAEEAVSNIK